MRSWAQVASVQSAAGGDGGGRTATTRDSWQPGMVLLRGSPACGAPDSSKIGRAEFVELAEAIKNIVPGDINDICDALPPYPLSHQMPIRI